MHECVASMDFGHAPRASELGHVGHVGLLVQASLRTHVPSLEEHRAVKPRYSLALRRCKMQHKALLDFVYRSGRQALADWGSKFTPALSTNRTADVVQRIAFDARLRIDYLQSLI